jgi:hypothetical protein
MVLADRRQRLAVNAWSRVLRSVERLDRRRAQQVHFSAERLADGL